MAVTPCSLVATVRAAPASLAEGIRALEGMGAQVRTLDEYPGDTCWLTVEVPDERRLRRAETFLRKAFGSGVLACTDRAFAVHAGGMVRVEPKVAIGTMDTVDLVGGSGSVRVASYLAGHPEAVRDFTGKGQSVLVVSDGSAVPGLGDVGPEAVLPVLGGRAALLRRLAGLQAMPIALSVRDPKAIADAVAAIAPGFAAVDLEAIAAPRCYAVEEDLRSRLDVPVLQGDRDGTAVVILAALGNALRLVGKRLPHARVVVAADGGATVLVRQLLAAGGYDVTVCRASEVLERACTPHLPRHGAWVAVHTNPRNLSGGVADALAGADVLITFAPVGLSPAGIVAAMAPAPIVFLLAGADVDPIQLADRGAIVATGQAHYPNHIDSLLAYPGLLRGVIDARLPAFSETMLLAAADALAHVAAGNGPNRLLPRLLDPEVVLAVAGAVAGKADSLCSHLRPTVHAASERAPGPGPESCDHIQGARRPSPPPARRQR